MMSEVYYWSPCLNKVGTYWSTMNSAMSLAKYSDKKFSVKIFNICGEWDTQRNFLEQNNIEIINLGPNYFKFLPKSGFLKSRISFFFIFFISFFPLLFFLKKKKPEFLVAHLITSLPITLFSLFSFKTKLILRISGLPKLNIIRKTLWKIVSNKIYKVTCPSKDLLSHLDKMRIFQNSKICFLQDPIIRIEKFISDIKSFKNKIDYSKNRKYFISVGRLTKQKNFTYLINEFKEFSKTNNNYDLMIFGEGEEEMKLQKQINDQNLSNRVFLKGYSTRIYSHMKNADAFILSSLWEDPGFVLIEAGLCNLSIISSNCKNGPSEFLQNGKGGILFESNQKNALNEALKTFLKLNKDFEQKKIITKKNCLKYTLFRHFITLNKILSRN